MRQLLDHPEFSKVLRAAVEAQRLVPGSIMVSGTAAALYAGHRLSLHSDHIVPEMVSCFDAVVSQVEKQRGGKKRIAIRRGSCSDLLTARGLGFDNFADLCLLKRPLLKRHTGP